MDAKFKGLKKKQLISLFLLLFDTQDLILRKLDQMEGFELTQKLKQQYKQIEADCKVLKTRSEKFEDTFNEMVNYRQFDDLRKDANFLARINLLIFDRCRDTKEENLLENYLKAKPEGGIFDKELIENFRMK